MRRRTAILIFDEVEVLDFAGPFEVFSVTDEISRQQRFHVFTVAQNAGTVRARNGLKVVPDFTLENAPAAHILIIPGGYGTRALLKKPALIEWVRRQARDAELVISVCTGALVLGQAGLLDGLEVTTHIENLDELARVAPSARVRGDRRFHDNGKLLTAAGISAGIDVSLHTIARLHGADDATATARYMEYHWRNDDGLTR